MRRQTNNVIPFKTKKALSSFLLHCHPRTNQASLSKRTLKKAYITQRYCEDECFSISLQAKCLTIIPRGEVAPDEG